MTDSLSFPVNLIHDLAQSGLRGDQSKIKVLRDIEFLCENHHLISLALRSIGSISGAHSIDQADPSGDITCT